MPRWVMRLTSRARVALADPQAPGVVAERLLLHLTLSNGTGTDIFCSSQIMLPSGASVVLNGGDNWTGSSTTNGPNNNSNLLDVATRSLTRANNMNRQR